MFPKGNSIKSSLSLTGDAIRRRRGGWFLAREADVAKAKTHYQNPPSRPDFSTAFFVVRIWGMSKSGFKFMRKSIFRRSKSS